MSPSKKQRSEFRKCECGRIWETRDTFLRDKNVKIVGYQPDFINRKYNHFLFQHATKRCGRYLGVRASDFADLRERECPAGVCVGKDGCPGYCLNTFDLRVCSVTCRNAVDRRLAAKIRNRRILRELASAVARSQQNARSERTTARSR